MFPFIINSYKNISKMKSQINEVKLIYRTLSDQFFVIHKPVNWTLKKKKKEKKLS